MTCQTFTPPVRNGLLARIGDAMQRHQKAIRGIQWVVVLFYIVLVAVPAFLPLPDHSRHILNNLTLFAQFLFWGIWWPFVLLSMVLVGRMWCGIFCPEGTLSEWASRHGRGGAIPRWMRWGGWPFIAFVLTTIYGQMVSVYQYPKATLLILGGSTVAAILVGYLYGRNRRVWCRYLCPVNGVFGLLAKLAPLHYRTDEAIWVANRSQWRGVHTANCPTLLPLHALDNASPCHMCGRCSGYRDAIGLAARVPGAEVVTSDPQHATLGEFLLITFGLGGIAVGAFHWSASPWFVTLKQQLALWLIDHDGLWVLQQHAPWWLFTNYPQQNDVFNLLDGGLLLAYITLTGLLLGVVQFLFLGMSARLLGGPWRPRLFHLAYALIPLVGAGVFLGLSAVTVSMLRAELLSITWASPLRALVLGGTTAWSLWLLWSIVHRHLSATARALAAFAVGCGAIAVVAWAWYLLFWGWS